MAYGNGRTLAAHVISMIGSWWGILIATSAVYLIFPISQERLVTYFVWIFAPTILSEIIKFAFRRKRPVHRGISVRVKTYGYSFPSSHTVAAFMIASWVLLIPHLHWWSYLFVLWPFIVGWSRIWLRAHDKWDVLGGFVFGSLAMGVLWFVY